MTLSFTKAQKTFMREKKKCMKVIRVAKKGSSGAFFHFDSRCDTKKLIGVNCLQRAISVYVEDSQVF